MMRHLAKETRQEKCKKGELAQSEKVKQYNGSS